MPHYPQHHPHHPPHHMHKAGEKLVGFPNEILNLMFPEADEAEWALENIINEGPPHKQIRSALLMKSVANLLQSVSKVTGQQPEFVPGHEIQADDHHDFEEYSYSIQLPEEILTAVKDRRAVLREVGMGAPHDVLRDVILLTAMQWMQAQLSKIQNTNNDEKKSTQ
jgi:hypothetical protein